MKVLIFVFLSTFFVCCQENNPSHKDAASKNFPVIPDNNSLDFKLIKQQSVSIKALNSMNVAKLPLKKTPRDFIIKYLDNCKLPLTQEIDEIHQFDYYFLDYKQTNKYFSFTLLSKSETIKSTTIFLFVADLEKGDVRDCGAIAEYYDYDSSLIAFEIKFNEDEIIVNQTASAYNNNGKLETKKQKITCTIDSELKIQKKRAPLSVISKK